MQKKQRIKKIIALFLIISGLLIIVYDKNQENYESNKEQKKINNYLPQKNPNQKSNLQKTTTSNFNNTNYNYIGIIEIPKIKLKKPVAKLNSKNNNISKNIQTIKYQNPSQQHSTILLAAHSGNSKISFFKNLHKLKINDYIYLYTKKEKYIYQIIKKYKVKKTGIITITDYDKQLILTTCSMTRSDKQLIIISTQIKKYLL